MKTFKEYIAAEKLKNTAPDTQASKVADGVEKLSDKIINEKIYKSN